MNFVTRFKRRNSAFWMYEGYLTWVALWGHFDRLHHGAHCCRHIGWFSIWVVCGIIIRLFSNGLTAIGCFALLSVLSEFLHVEIGNFTFSQLRKKLFGCLLKSFFAMF